MSSASSALTVVPRNHMVVRMRRRPVGDILPGRDLVVVTEKAPSLESVKVGEVFCKRLYLSLDPAMRGWMRNMRSYVPPVKVGAVMRGSTVNEVVESKSDRFKRGDIVLDSGMGDEGWSEYAIVNHRQLTKIDTQSLKLLPSSAYLGILGGTGLTAYFGLLKVARPIAGETLLVSGAAGATGSVVAQIGKILGLKVVGIAGGKKKCEWLQNTLKLDATVDYKRAENDPARFQAMLRAALRRVKSKGFDIFFDNVGGYILDETLRRLNMRGRIVCCGAISAYNAKDPREDVRGLKNYQALISLRARMEGFIVFDYAKEFTAARRQLAKWIREGLLIYEEDVREGIISAPYALVDLFNGKKKGKLVVKIASSNPDCRL